MANPELSRLAARLFNQYKVPLDKGFDWAVEVEKADSKEDLSKELQEFLDKPYFINPKPESSALDTNRFIDQAFTRVVEEK